MDSDKYFLKVNIALVRKLGADAAILHAFLLFTSRYRNKDVEGYCTIETEYIRDHLGWSKRKIIRTREKIMEVGLLRFKQGVNQNIKNKYLLVKQN